MGSEPNLLRLTEVDAEDADYAGVFAVGDDVYDVTGIYNGYYQGDVFIFTVPLSELQPVTSPAAFLGLMWSGTMTGDTYEGGWFFNSETSHRSPAGEFVLERAP